MLDEFLRKKIMYNHEKYGAGTGTVIQIVNEELLMVELDDKSKWTVLYLYPRQVEIVH